MLFISYKKRFRSQDIQTFVLPTSPQFFLSAISLEDEPKLLSNPNLFNEQDHEN